MEGDNRGKKGKDHQGTCIKDPWTKTMGERIECRRWGWVGQGRVMGENGDNFNCTIKNNNFKSYKATVILNLLCPVINICLS